MDFTPGYLKLLESGELERRADRAWQILRQCRLCPHACGVNRLDGQTGFCGVGELAVVSSYGPHFGEEPPLIGPPGNRKGSGTIFFSGCNLSCIYCQNYEISQQVEGSALPPEFIAAFFLSLQAEGCHNINLVTPTHVVPQIVRAIVFAAKEGLTLPIVYNCGGYESLDTLALLDGIVDIYMPDFKYSDDEIASELSKAPRYWEHARAAFREMHRQTGELIIHEGVARRGLLVRHLVLPGGLSGYDKIFRFIASELSPDTFINIMDQYRPCWRAFERPPLDRRITSEEFKDALDAARKAGLRRVMQFVSPE